MGFVCDCNNCNIKNLQLELDVAYSSLMGQT